jgi:hypothetical protein
MNRQELLELERNAHLTPAEVRTVNPQLASEVQARLEARAKTVVDQVLGISSPRIREMARNIRVPLDGPVGNGGTRGLHEAVLGSLRERVNADATLRSDVAILSDLENLQHAFEEPPAVSSGHEATLTEVVGLDLPIAVNPEFSRDLAKARLYRLAEAAALPVPVADILATDVGDVTAITDTRLKALVDARRLTADQAKIAGRAAALHAMLDERPELVARVNRGLTDIRTLARQDDAAWTVMVRESATKPPADISVESYAGILGRKARALYPADALAGRLSRGNVGQAVTANAGLAALRAANPGVSIFSARDFNSLKTGPIPAADRPRVQDQFNQAKTLANRYPGMRLDQVLDNPGLNDAARLAEVTRRTGLVDSFLTKHANALALDLTPRSPDLARLSFDPAVTPADRAGVLATVRAYQRTFAVSGDIDVASALVAGGYHSAVAIATAPPEALRASSGLAATAVTDLRDNAASVASGVGAQAGSLIDAVTGGFNELNVNNVQGSVLDYLKEIPGFEAFFGSQAYCTCSHCQSILGPAAYFVDLMNFVERNVTQPHFATAAANHPLRLRTRRPDLWSLELTCANTNTPIPYLTIITEVLEDAIAAEAGFTGPPADRAAKMRLVYRDTLPEKEDSFEQPFHLPLEELASYLRHFETNLADLGETAGATGDALTRLRLGLSPKQFQLVTEARDTLAALRLLYGFNFVETGGTIDKFDAQQLVRGCGVTREELQELIGTQYVTARGTIAVKIVGEKRSPQSVQNDIERVSGATRPVLDRLHRFVRLWRATRWRIGELDLAIQHLEDTGIGTGLDKPLVGAVARLVRLGPELETSAEELLSLVSPLPVRSVTTSAALAAGKDESDVLTAYPEPASPLAYLTVPLLDRVFNSPPAIGGVYPQDATLVLHPALATGAPPAADPHLARLKAGLGTDDEGLYRLLVGLARPLGIDPDAAADAGRRVALRRRNLTLLYRHARLARLLGVSIPELFVLIAADPAIPHGFVDSLDDLTTLVRTSSWLRETRWSAAQLAELLRPGTPAILTSQAPVTSITAGQVVTYTTTELGQAKPPETITFAANANLPAAVANWNAQAQTTVAYRADAQGSASPTGGFLAIRTRAGGPTTKIQLTADAAGMFAATLPRVVTGRAVVSGAAQSDAPTSASTAAEVVQAVDSQGKLIFADTVFALVPPIAPVVVSRAAVAGSAGGEVVTIVPTLDGRLQAAETVTLHANTSIDAVVADWNAQSVATRAYRADASGAPKPNGNRLGVQAEGGTGSDTTLQITADSGSLFTTAVPSVVRGVEVTPDQSKAIIGANPTVFEPAGGAGRFRLRAAYDPAVALTLPAGVEPSLEPRLRETIAAYHGEQILLADLPSRLGITPPRLRRFVALLGLPLGSTGFFGEIRGEGAPNRIKNLIDGLRRLAILFADEQVFTEARLAFVGAQAARFEITGFDRIGLAGARAVEGYRRVLSRTPGTDPTPIPIDAVVTGFDPATRFNPVDPDALARVLGSDRSLAQSLARNLTLKDRVFPALEQLSRTVPIAQQLGVGGELFAQIQSADYDTLAQASGALQAGFRTKYQDEAEWREKDEPFRDRVLSKRRDGLVAWLLHTSTRPFDEVSDLYHYYLLDCQLEGCMRTSRVAAAIDSLQLYVQRCVMNLEESPAGAADPRHVLPGSISEREWAWRRNYRVWEANRKIFLYPENYIEPELRDDKTPLFKALEEELFSKEITEETILEAYARYLRGFDELSHLSIAGTYHEKDPATQRDVLHLIGATADDPPVFYYRRVENAEAGVSSDARATRWAAWEKLDVQIPVRRVAPLVHQGQIYAFWIRYTTKPLSEVKGGNSKFTGYQHRAFVEFTRRRLDGTWTAPQRLRLNERPFDIRGDGVILDPIVPKTSQTHEILWFNLTLYSDFQPLYDSRQHEVPKDDYTPRGFMWDPIFPSSGKNISLRGANFQMWSPVDLYRLEIGPREEDLGDPNVGVPWLNPAIFILIWIFSGGKFDLTKLLPPRLVWSRVENERRRLFRTPSGLPCFDTYTYAYILSDEARITHYEQAPHARTNDPRWQPVLTDYLHSILKENPIGDVAANTWLEVINGSVGDAILQTSSEAFYLQSRARTDGRYHLRRLGSSVSGDVADILYRDGLSRLLATSTQMSLAEDATGINLASAEGVSATTVGSLDFRGAMGVYLREIFFHVPFLIANYFNSQGEYEQAQRWYHKIFDPTANETIAVPGGLSPEERARREADRVWRYREFRGLDAASLRAQLTDAGAIEAYRRDPFNPHAIARLRVSAYQKAIVMKYVDNLLDWGDQLFALAFSQLNPEYLREATQKYVMAQEILGTRPARLGGCGEGQLAPKNYENILTATTSGSEFLAEVESLMITSNQLTGAVRSEALLEANPEWIGAKTLAVYTSAPVALAAPVAGLTPVVAGPGPVVAGPGPVVARPGPVVAGPGPVVAGPRPAGAVGTIIGEARTFREVPVEERKKALASLTQADLILRGRAQPDTGWRGIVQLNPTKVRDDAAITWIPEFTIDLVKQLSPLFCVPSNDRLRKYWDRVEDRLYKLRHCMDPEGNFRLLPLWAPPLDPGLLARLGAAGLSLEDVLTGTGGDLPPYRFAFLIDKARQYAGTVQSFGTALLGALERRDTEELTRIRNTHLRNVLALTTDLRRNEVKLAAEGVEIATRRQAVAEFTRDYYSGLLDGGLTGAEVTQEVARSTASILKGAAGLVDTLSAIAHLVPNAGSPFAMTYGGMQLGMSAKSWSEVVTRLAEVADSTAVIAGIVGGYERREQGWDYQKKVAAKELRIADRELVVAEIRKAMADRGLELHQQAKDQHDEILEFYQNRFTSLALYRALARSLQQLHREAYNDAAAMAKLAERAYHNERPGDTTVFVGGEWDGSRGGLHAGERLLLALQRMERRFLETNTRTNEINQTFSIGQIRPEALVQLKESGSCDFALSELFFDLFYPGQYRRRIRSVRLTIPCVTGPYTNMGARLTLVRSFIRTEPRRGTTALREVPRQQTGSVSTSTAQGDSGVFELSFRDERYMPFEGGGAVSEWRLELPRNFRPFDYQTITDVLINLSYTADEDATLRGEIEAVNSALEGSLTQVLRSQNLTRVLSLRQEYSTAFNRLIQAPAGTPVTIDVTDRHLPLFLRGRPVVVTGGRLALVTEGRLAPGATAFTVNGVAANAFPNPTSPAASSDPFGGLSSKTLGGAFGAGLRTRHTIVATNAGALAPAAAGGPLFDPDKLSDVLLAIDYRLA